MAQDNLTKRNPLSTVLIVLAVIIAILVAVIAIQPSEFRVTRTASINAAPEFIFEQVNDLHKWEAWSPWAKLDPNAKSTYQGPESGKDASVAWEGNSDVGAGVMTITESQPTSLIRIKLEFKKPMEGVNTTEFKFVPENNQTVVTWDMTGQKNFVAKAIGLVMNCEKMVGEQFEQGLASLKTIAEASAAKSVAPAPEVNETGAPIEGETVAPVAPEGSVSPEGLAPATPTAPDAATTAPTPATQGEGTTTPPAESNPANPQ